MWFICDACGIVCFLIAYGILIGSNVTVLKLGVWPTEFRNCWICFYEILFAMSIWSHLATMLSDPGAVPLDKEPADGEKRCSKCHASKPPKAHHCRTCQRCIMKMDHHCPWVNNCVGQRNQKYFLLFLFYVNIQSFTAMFALGGAIASMDIARPTGRASKAFLAPSAEAGHEIQTRQAEPAELGVLCVIMVIVVALVFGLFTLIMMCDQVSNISSNVTGIDSLQGHTGVERPWKDALQEVMGKGPGWKWLLPVPPRLRITEVKGES